ncbi:MFS transporter [Microbacterium murale]|uniref:CP family cyanate transporter-like MFS transporter n=1 Tax=Microbacterium murale TaxID=1081040 RepID=A0ABU0P9I0_9MICO|nr:MFS transporter [Microbacterium murale]MDQ0643990.1 CP family cyanate transporter-like MFS transporter [Microbacterium murale]
MTTSRPLWQGRALAVLGILLCAFSLRSAVASLSPLFDHVAADFPLSSAVVGLIGTAPPVCFAVFGLLTPVFERRLGLERVTVIALIAIAAGLVLRGFSVDAVTLLLSTALIFAGVGMGNILLPPLVKKYFPDRLGLMMTLYTTAMALSTFIPPLVAVPVADAAGWRVSLAMWGVFALAGSIPWVLMLLRGRTEGVPVPAVRDDRSARDAARADAEESEPVTLVTGPIAVAPANSRIFARLVRLPLAWSIAIVFGTSSTMAYVSFAWLPAILVDRTGVSASVAGLLLSLFAFMGLPASLVVPLLVVRFQATRPLFIIAVACGIVGLAGLILVPSAALVGLWVALFGVVGVLFPLALVLISVRARTPETAVALSSFVQSAGYIGAAAFPILLGVVHDQTDDWLVPLLIIGAVLVISVPFGLIAGRRQTIEAEWERRHGRW